MCILLDTPRIILSNSSSISGSDMSAPRGQEDSVDFAISFEDVSVFQYREDGGREKVISNVTGCVHSGDVLAIIGPSSQSCLLLDTLRGVHLSGDRLAMSGTLSWNGQPPGTRSFVSVSAQGTDTACAEEVDPRALAYVDVKESCALLPDTLSSWEVLYFTIKARVAFLSTGEQSTMVDQVPAPAVFPHIRQAMSSTDTGCANPGAGHAGTR